MAGKKSNGNIAGKNLLQLEWKMASKNLLQSEDGVKKSITMGRQQVKKCIAMAGKNSLESGDGGKKCNLF